MDYQILPQFLGILFGLLLILEECSGQLVHEQNQTPTIGIKGTRCYDQFNRPQRCIPEFENAAFNMQMEATNTCGIEQEQEYCVQTGVTGLRKSCSVCYPGQYDARFLTDIHNVDNPTWWQSETMYEGIQWPNQVNLTLRFGKAFDITYIRLWFMSPRPESFSISKKTTDDGPWIPFQYYSATCRDTYGLPDKTSTSKGEETRALCTSEYSDISPLRAGNVAFGTLEGRPSAYNFDASPDLQEWVTATELRITLDRLNTFGDEVFGDPQVLRSYFYAIADVAVGARCKCNGHASECVSSTGPNNTRTRVCRCEHNTDGQDCGKCLPFYNDAPWARATALNAHECKACNCNGFSTRCVFNAKLYEQTGHGGYCLDCAAFRDGPNCEKCRPNYYMREDGICIPCQCDEEGSFIQQCNFEGKCQCKPGVGGDKCDRCLENHYDFTKSGCKSCGCNLQGSAFNVAKCNPFDGICECKENVEGKQCKECKPGFFNLDSDNEFGCTPCFCYGHSSQCKSASGYSKYFIKSSFTKSSEKWRAEDPYGRTVPIRHESVSQSIGSRAEDDQAVYFLAPDRFLGDQRASYNQILEFKLNIGETNGLPSAMDIILEGNGLRITNTIFAQGNKIPLLEEQTYQFRLHEHSDFQWQPHLNSRDFISVLTNLTSIKIRGTYSPKGKGFLHEFKLNTATRGAAGDPAMWMEFCECPRGYIGQFCESCDAGFRHSPAHGGPFTNCIPCDCNQHADICDSETGRCICRDNTAGENCETCARGYYGNALDGTANDCQPCNCPNGGPCLQLSEEIVMCTECPAGYGGFRCEICSDGYFGNPPYQPCQACDCNGNVDPNNIENCNTTTGQCLRCIYNTAGPRCEVCLPGFYGNALVLPKGDCKRCQCYHVGTEADLNLEPICDSTTGACRCKSRVTGRNCDQCEEGYFNLQSGEGCQSCNCDPTGSYNNTCDLYTGQCFCRQGITGLRCDHCEAKKYGFSVEGCKNCDCDTIGSKDLQCDPSGQCPCLDNVEGRRCDRCKENKYDRHRGCVDCPDCYNLVQSAYRTHNTKLDRLKSILNDIEGRPTVIADEEFPIELTKLQDDIDEFYEQVKTATGKNSIIDQYNDMVKREKEITNTLDNVEENLYNIDEITAQADGIGGKTADILVDLDQELKDIRTQFENEAKKALADALERSKHAGQQSNSMTKIAQEAREIADALEKQADNLVGQAKEAKNKSSEVYDMVKKSNSEQELIRANITRLKSEIDKSEEKLNNTLAFTVEVNKKAGDVKNEAVELLNEVKNLFVPSVDIPELKKKANSLKNDAKSLGDKSDGLLNRSIELQNTTDQKTKDGVELLARAEDQLTKIQEFVDEIHNANKTVSETISKWTEKLNEAERIYNDLRSSDSDTQKSREEAEAALQTIPKIRQIIDDILDKAEKSQSELENISVVVKGALDNAVDAKKEQETASNQLENIHKDAEGLNKTATDLLNQEKELEKSVEESNKRLKELLHGPLSNSTLVDQAKENVGKAGQEANKVSEDVSKLLEDVQSIITELNNTQDIDDSQLERLDEEIAAIEKRINETQLEKHLKDLQDKHNTQSNLIEDYKGQIEKLQGDVENIKHIVDALPEGCFKNSVQLEP